MASREVFWNISAGYLVYVFAIIAVGYWAYSFYRRTRIWRIGKPDDRTKDLGKRLFLFVRTKIVDFLAHRRFLSDPFPGIMHLLIFWGFLILLLASAVDAITHYGGIHIAGTPYLWFSLIADIAGIIVLVGIAMAAFRRYFVKPERLVTVLDDGIVTAFIAIIIVTGFMVEGFRMAATEIDAHPDWAIWSPGGLLLARTFAGLNHDSLLWWHGFMWWFHAAISLAAFVYSGLAFSKLQHVVVSPVNVFFRSLGPMGTPEPLNIENEQDLGVGSITDFSWKQLLDLDACTNCGRCQDGCPAWATGKPLSPRKMIQDLKFHMLKAAADGAKGSGGPSLLVVDAPSEAEIWACTTCAACQERCPVYVEHIVKIIDLRRNLVLAQNRMPESAQIMLRNMQLRGHPWAGVQAVRLRGDWMGGLELKIVGEGMTSHILFWAGCTGSLVERNVGPTVSMTRILKAAGIDFAVLGEGETCCGDPARRAGYEFQFQLMAEQNIETFKTYGIKQIITTCPHCYNAFKNEYPRYGGNFDVVHYSELIADLIESGRLKLSEKVEGVATYHDPCYLGRYNGIYSQPRKILRSIRGVTLKEMGRTKNRSFCCGGGGGHMWIEEHAGTTKINHARIEEVLETGADRVVAACPYCLQMFEEGIEQKNIKDSLKAMDLAEIVEMAIKYS